MEQSNAARVIIAVIPIVGIVMGCTVILFWLLWHHKRQTLLIQSGQYKKYSLNLNVFSLLCGLLLTSAGICLTVFFAVIRGADVSLLGGLVPLSVGLALLLFYFLNRRKPQDSGKVD
jgi:hypothetical protein